MDFLRLPFFSELADAKNILIAGAGGGFDVFSGLPLYFALQAAGKRVHLGNLTFSNLPPDTGGRYLTPELVEVTADSRGSPFYFPEMHLSRWFREQEQREVPVYCFHRTGPRPIIAAYQVLARHLDLDTIVLVDGGTDSLMRGDEQGLGTPNEDMTSIAAVHFLHNVPRKMLVCLGFGVDAFHGVSHSHVLEAVAELSRAAGYLGAFSLMEPMSEVQKFRDATRYVLERTPDRISIVCSSILAAIEGRFGDYHTTDRTAGSELFINPLMSFYWCFRLEQVAGRVMYLDGLREIEGYLELSIYITSFQARLPALRAGRSLPI
jgi:hypothetical protein